MDANWQAMIDPAARQPRPPEPEVERQSLLLPGVGLGAAVLTVVAVVAGAGPWVLVAAVVACLGGVGTLAMAARSRLRDRLRNHQFELQQCRFEFWNRIRGLGDLPALTDELRSHFPAQMEPVMKHWEVVTPDNPYPGKPQPNITALQTYGPRTWAALDEIACTESVALTCNRCRNWLWLCRLLRAA